MTTIGDGFLIVATILGLFLTSWATSVSMMLLFPVATERARIGVEEQPVKSVVTGFLLLITLGTMGVVLLSLPLPLVKLSGWTLTLGLLAMAAIGTAGIAQAAGNRLRALDPEVGHYPSMAKGAAYVIGATLLPILGWFFFGPLLLLGSLGAGYKALRALGSRRDASETV